MIEPFKYLRHFGFFIISMTIVVGCGKKQGETKSDNVSPEQSIKPIMGAALQEFLDKQVAACGPEGCPDYINKIAVVDRGEVRFCTGFLTDTGTVATSASCLPDLVRFQGQDCSSEIFFFFPRTISKPAIQVGCRRVLQASRIDSSKAYLWRENIAFLELDQNVFRRTLRISREGLADKKKFDIWKVDQVDKYIGIIRREECTAMHGTYMNPLASHKFSPNMMMGNCAFVAGNSGAPIIDSMGRLRGLASGDMDKELITNLEKRGLMNPETARSMMYVSNMACASNIDDYENYPDSECMKSLTENAVTGLRALMIDEKLLFADYMAETQKAITDNNKFINFEVRLVENQKGKFNVQFYPKCFINPGQWRNKPPRSKNFTISASYFELERTLDAYTKPKVNLLEAKSTLFKVEFSPREVLGGTSGVTIKSDIFSSSHDNIPSNCALLR